MRTFAEILKEAMNRDLMLANLYQRRTYPAHPNDPSLPTGEWLAEFLHKNGHRDSDIAKTPEAALEEALARAKGLKGLENRADCNPPTALKEDSPVDDII